MATFEDLSREVRDFSAARDWAQFHTPKNLSMALIVEAGELVEHFQWVTADQSDDLNLLARQAVAEELADIQIYLILLADRLSIDLLESARAKVAANAGRYPVETARGNARKANP